MNPGSVGPQLSEFLTHVLPGSGAHPGGRLGWGLVWSLPSCSDCGVVWHGWGPVCPPSRCTPALPSPAAPHGAGAPASHGAAPKPAPLQALPWILHQGPVHEASTVWAKARIPFPWQQPGNFAVTSVLARMIPRPRKGEPSTQGYTAQGFKPEGPCFLGA